MSRIGCLLAAALLTALIQLTYALECHPNPQDHPKSLFAVKGATDVEYLECQYPNGWQPDQVIYRVKASYPASDVIAELSNALARDRWQALKTDQVKSKEPPVTLWKWKRKIVSANNRQLVILTWSGQWRSPSGEFLNYILSYTRPLGTQTLPPKDEDLNVSDLDVMGMFVRADQSGMTLRQ